MQVFECFEKKREMGFESERFVWNNVCKKFLMGKEELIIDFSGEECEKKNLFQFMYTYAV